MTGKGRTRGKKGFVFRPMLLLSQSEAIEVIERNTLGVAVTGNGRVVIYKNSSPKFDDISLSNFFEILDSRHLGVFKAQDSDYLKYFES